MRTFKKESISYKLALIGMLAAVCMALSALEGWLPPLPVPGARLGLANVAITAAMWLTGPVGGAAVGLCKVGFAFLTRGASAALMALGGTVLSLAITVILLPLVRRQRLTFVGVSVAAAGCHTVGQLLTASWMLSTAVVSYAPVLLLISTVSGTLTGVVLNALIPKLSVTSYHP